MACSSADHYFAGSAASARDACGIDCIAVWIAFSSTRPTCFNIWRSDGRTYSEYSFDVLRYDLTSIYMEGEGEQIPKLQTGHMADKTERGHSPQCGAKTPHVPAVSLRFILVGSHGEPTVPRD